MIKIHQRSGDKRYDIHGQKAHYFSGGMNAEYIMWEGRFPRQE